MKNLRSFIPEIDLRLSPSVQSHSPPCITDGKKLLARRMLPFSHVLPSQEIHITHIRHRVELGSDQGVTKRRRLSGLTNRLLVYVPKFGGGGEVRGLSQWVQLYTGAQINFGDPTPYLAYGRDPPDLYLKNGSHGQNLCSTSAQAQLIAQYFLIENQYIFGPRIGNSCT